MRNGVFLCLSSHTYSVLTILIGIKCSGMCAECAILYSKTHVYLFQQCKILLCWMFGKSDSFSMGRLLSEQSWPCVSHMHETHSLSLSLMVHSSADNYQTTVALTYKESHFQLTKPEVLIIGQNLPLVSKCCHFYLHTSEQQTSG